LALQFLLLLLHLSLLLGLPLFLFLDRTSGCRPAQSPKGTTDESAFPWAARGPANNGASASTKRCTTERTAFARAEWTTRTAGEERERTD